MSTITKDQEQAIADYINSHYLPSGIGTKDAACSIAAINIALTNTLTDTVPGCMSAVIGRWIITIQDAVPDAIRNSQAWKSLLPTAAGTGREREKERLGIIMDWMWRDVLSQVQGVADEGGYGQEWLTMCKLKTARAADAAACAADAAAGAARAAGAAACAADAADAADAAACVTVRADRAAADAADAAACAADAAAGAATDAAAGAATDADAAAGAAFWDKCDPAKLLVELIQVGVSK